MESSSKPLSKSLETSKFDIDTEKVTLASNIHSSSDDLDINKNNLTKSLSDLRLDYRQWRTGSNFGADFNTFEKQPISPIGLPLEDTYITTEHTLFESQIHSNQNNSSATSNPTISLPSDKTKPMIDSTLNGVVLSASPEHNILPFIPERSNVVPTLSSPLVLEPPANVIEAEERSQLLSSMFSTLDKENGTITSTIPRKLSSSWGRGIPIRSSNIVDRDTSIDNRPKSGGMTKSVSYTGLKDLEKRTTTFFPEKPKMSASGIQRSLKDSVMNDMCRAVVKQMVGDLYVVSKASPGKKVVNHLYQPMFENVQKHFKQLPARYALSVNPDDVPMHMRLLGSQKRYPDALAMHCKWLIEEDGRVSSDICEVVVVSKDQDNLLDAITRGLTSLKGYILDADVITSKLGVVLDRFLVRGNFVDKERLGLLRSRIENNLNEFAQLRDQDNGKNISSNIVSSPNLRQISPLYSSDSNGFSTSTLSSGVEKMIDNHHVQAEWKLDMQEIILEAPIGSGRSGQTYVAKWRGTRVAAKVINVTQHGSLSEEILGEFHREVAVVSRLRHPNIVLFIGVAINVPTYCLVFEFMKNGTLTNLLRTKKCIVDFFQMATEIALGMNYLHLCSIIHRDLKSGNILIDHHGTVKVADFGLSCVLENGGESDMTAETGTYRWMAPEVIRHEPYSHKADVYSYGVVLWEMITKEQPFRGMTPIQAAFAVARQQMRPALPTYTPLKLGELVEHCWHQDPQCRPTFGEILEVLPLVAASFRKRDYSQLNFSYTK